MMGKPELLALPLAQAQNIEKKIWIFSGLFGNDDFDLNSLFWFFLGGKKLLFPDWKRKFLVRLISSIV